MLEGSKVLNWRRNFREKENKINGFEFRCLYRTVPTLCLKFYCRYRCKGVSKGDTVVEKKVNTTNCLGKNLFFGVRVKVSNVISHEKKGMAKSVVVNYRREELR